MMCAVCVALIFFSDVLGSMFCFDRGGMGFIDGFGPIFFFFFFYMLWPVLEVEGEKEVSGGGLPSWWWV